LQRCKQAILIGGGLVGWRREGFDKTGIKVAVIEYNPRILPRQMDPEGAQILQAKLEGWAFLFPQWSIG